MPTLFDPLNLGGLELPNRIFMAPLTRCRAEAGRIPGASMARYYAQRASAGLILSEATSVSPLGVGYPDTPGIWSLEQLVGWTRVVKDVHAAGGRIFLQLWHVGRISDPFYLEGQLPVAPSAIAATGHVSLLRPQKPYVTPRALDLFEMPGIVDSYRAGARNAKEAGFDGVEVHSANGYLLDQFLQDGSNHRTDGYGGSVENRSRLLLEVVDAVSEVWGPGRVGVHLAPRGGSGGIADSDPRGTFSHVARELGARGIGFLCLRESAGPDSLAPELKRIFGGILVANEGFTKASATEWLEAGKADAVAFGVPFLANPDLPARLRSDAPFNPPRRELFYGSGEEGYTDYPAL